MPLVKRILVRREGLPCLDLPVSNLCAWKVEEILSSSGGGCDQEIIDNFDWVIDVSWRIWILDSSITAMTILRRSAQPWSCWSGGMQLRSGILRGLRSVTVPCSWRRLIHKRLITLQLLRKYTQSKVLNKCTQNKIHATQLGTSARLTAVALTEISDVSTFVESSMMSSRILKPRGASIVV